MWNFVEVTSKRSIGAAFCSRAKKKKKVLRERTGEEGEERGIIVRCKGKKGIDALLCRVGLNLRIPCGLPQGDLVKYIKNFRCCEAASPWRNTLWSCHRDSQGEGNFLSKKAPQLRSRAWRGGGREVYLGAEGVLLRENGCCVGGCDRWGEGKAS